MFALLGLAVVAAGLLAYRSSRAEALRQAEAELGVVAALKVQQVSLWREERLFDAATIAGSRLAARALAGPTRAPPDRLGAQLGPWLSSLRHDRNYVAASLLDVSGRRLAAVEDDGREPPGAEEPEFAEAIRSGAPVLSDVRSDRAPYLIMAVPLAPEGTGPRPAGVVLVRVDPRARLFAALRPWPTASATGEIHLVRRDGDVAVLLDGAREAPGAPEAARIPVNTDDPAARAARGQSGSVEGRDRSGRAVFAAIRPVPNTSWLVVARKDASEVLAPARARTAWLVGLALAGMALAGAVVALWWRQQQAFLRRRHEEAELEQRALRRQLDLVTRWANDAVLLLDADLNVVEVNDRTVEAYGFSREELLRMRLRDLRAPETVPQLQEEIRRAREAGGLRYETVHRRRDGGTVPVEVSIRPYEVDGRPFYQALIRDVSERKAAEAAMRESEEQFRAVFLEAPIGVVLVGQDGAIQGFNRAFQEMLGHDEGELRRISMFELSHPEDRQAAAEAFERMGRGRLPRVEMDKRYLRRTGEVVYARIRAAPVRDASGLFRFAVMMIEDVTEQRRAEEALRESEERLQRALEATSDGLWDWNVPSDQLFVSPRFLAMLGYAPGDITGEASLQALLHPDDRERDQQAFREALTGSAPAFRAEMRVRTKAGDWRWVENRAKVAQRDAEGRPLRVVGAFTDIDDRKRMQARLLLSDRMTSLGTLAAGVAHEMNNPLAYVAVNLGFAATALSDAPAAVRTPLLAEAQRALDEARDGVERVRQIVGDLRTFSQPGDQGRSQVDVRDALRSAINLSQNEIRHCARLVQELEPVPTVLANAAKLGQVFLNLLLNAAQAIPEGRAEENTIRVATRLAASGHVAVEVSDTGSGIPPEVLHRIFDPFFTTKRVGEGSGLGLAICHGIVTSLGGEIQVESELGKGSLFRVLLPATGPGTVAPEAGQPQAAAPARGQILVVDDEPRLGRSIERLLAPHHQVVAVTSARDALARIAAGEHFDVILCDLMMPEMTGMDLHEELSRTAPRLAAGMVFMTGGAFTPRAREFLARVPNRRLEKPFRPETLEALVAELLAGSG